VKREKLEFLLENALHTQRFARYVGRRCRSGTIKDVAAELHLDWHTVKRLEKQYMLEQLKRAGTPRPHIIGIDEISVRKGHAILFDKFHVLRHLSEALDKVRKQEYARLSGRNRKFIKGQKYALLSHPENLTGDARKNLKALLAANKRLNTAYVLKESFAQLWDYTREPWARARRWGSSAVFSRTW
jgi:transposase